MAKECGISQPTARKWLSLLEATRIVYLLKPYHANLTKRVVKQPKFYFTDTGLLAYILRYPTPATLSSGAVAGAVFETAMIAEALKAKNYFEDRMELYFYRDSNCNEVDLVVDKGPVKEIFEFKLSKTPSADAINNVAKIKEVLKANRAGIVCFAEEKFHASKEIEIIPWSLFAKEWAAL